ncbi:MAG: hypothetical protein DI538_09025 [Azospira oryzae]|jgi:hypothetical protein|nr:MAG: hypothetical protein DI538_09025 [Azospira oryzae]
MKKLEDLPRKNIYQVPDGYFDKLPGVIQSRVARKENHHEVSWGLVFRYAFPVLLLAVAGIFWFNATTLGSAEEELQTVNPEQLSLFLNDTDLSTEELIETVAWSNTDLEDLADEVYSSLEVTGPEMDKVVDEYGSEL